MKTACILLASALGCIAQTAVYDTSFIKNGNTWVYVREEENVLFPSEGHLGTTRYTLDSVERSAGTVRFRVIREDSNRSNSVATDTVRYAVAERMLTPSSIFFFEGQYFSDADERRVHEGDTLRYRSTTARVGCYWTTSWNLEGVGRTRFESGKQAGCGMPLPTTTWTLIEFGGRPFSEEALSPVALFAGSRIVGPGMRREAKLLLHRGSVRYGREGKVFDLSGQRTRLRPVPTQP